MANKGAYINNGRVPSRVETALEAINKQYRQERETLFETSEKESWSEERLQHELCELDSKFMAAKRATCNAMLNTKH